MEVTSESFLEQRGSDERSEKIWNIRNQSESLLVSVASPRLARFSAAHTHRRALRSGRARRDASRGAMSRRAASAARAAAQIREGMVARKRREDFHAAVPIVGAGALTALVASAAYAPQLARFRRGVAEGLASDVSDVAPGGDAFLSALLRFTGLGLGGAAGARVAFQLAHAATAAGAARGYLRAPAAAVGGIACAFIGAEFAEPAATFGVRVGRVVRLGAEGLADDLSDAISPTARGPRAASSSSTSPSESSSDDRPVALALRLVRLRQLEAALRAERSVAATRHRRAELGAELRAVRERKAELKRRCAAANGGAKLGRVVAEDVDARARTLSDLRARQLGLRRAAAAAGAAGESRERRRLEREAKALDAPKKRLKAEARRDHGVHLARRTPSAEKR